MDTAAALPETPLVSFCISCYKQEQYIAQTLAGAFAQTYDNLEIVISDDCSPDGTVDVIKREIARYQASGGRHKIVLNVNETNLGNLGNWGKICSIAKGELLVKNDGDDISLPERTSKCVAAWLAAGKQHDVVSCAYYKMDTKGRVFGTHPPQYVLGTASCYTPKLFYFYGPPGRDGIDDVVWNYRMELLRRLGKSAGVLFVPDLLVRYRYASGITTRKKSYIDWLAKAASCGTMRQFELDLEKIAPLMEPAKVEQERAYFETCRKMGRAGKTLVLSRSFKERLAAFREMAEWHKNRLSVNYLMQVFLLLPRPVRDPVLELMGRTRDLWGRIRSAFIRQS